MFLKWPPQQSVESDALPREVTSGRAETSLNDFFFCFSLSTFLFSLQARVAEDSDGERGLRLLTTALAND